MKKLLLLLALVGTQAFAEQKFEVMSTDFQENGVIPKLYTCQGANVSPPMVWLGQPEGTKSYVLFETDPDAIATAGHVIDHWLAYNIPGDQTGLPVSAQGMNFGLNSFNNDKYQGPCPPAGSEHHYIFTLYALDVPSLNLPEGASMQQIVDAMQGHVIGEADMSASYKKE